MASFNSQEQMLILQGLNKLQDETQLHQTSLFSSLQQTDEKSLQLIADSFTKRKEAITATKEKALLIFKNSND